MDINVFNIVLYGIILSICQCSVLRNNTIWAEIKDSDTIQVTTDKGIVQGVANTTARGTNYASFRGIPFAAPPVGQLRFKDPIPTEQWSDILLAREFKERCYQIAGGAFVGNEDCLYLNVYSPGIDYDNPKPVVVHVHGGAFRVGNSRGVYDNFVDDDVVVVTVTYRLGVLGFLSLDTEEVPGNAAMKDLVMALKWVRENIRQFGGDEDNVTIIGESAGGHSVSHLQLSPMARGLFHKVIASSGTALNECAIQRNPQSKNEKLAEILGLDSTDQAAFLEDLQGITAEELCTASTSIEPEPGSYEEDLIFAPVVESTFEGIEPFFEKSPVDYITSREFSDVHTIIGYCNLEYANFFALPKVESHMEDDLIIVPDRWRLTATDTEVTNMAFRIREKYFGTQNFDPTNNEHILNAVDLLGDLKFILAIIETAKLMAQYSTNPVYLYRYSYRGTYSSANVEEIGAQGASHAFDGHYLEYTDSETYSADGWVVRRLVKLYTNFFKNGIPTPFPTSHLLPRIWQPVTEDTLHYLEINNDIIPSRNPNRHRMDFWIQLEEMWRNGQFS